MEFDYRRIFTEFNEKCCRGKRSRFKKPFDRERCKDTDAERAEDPLFAKLKAICDRYGIAAIYAFGSHAVEVVAILRGEETFPSHPQSDVDNGNQLSRGQIKESVEIGWIECQYLKLEP